MSTSATIPLATPITAGGVPSVYFFNGRLLTANDLAREQAARNEVNARLGRAVGDGVVTGLEVVEARATTRARPVVNVAAGLAINRCGGTLLLAQSVDVVLVREAALASAADTGFGPCRGLDGGTYIAGAGIYVLVIAPACTIDGKAATGGLDPGSARCNIDTTVAGVQFRLVQIDTAFSDADRADEARLRNRVAYACFGTMDLASIESQPFAPAANGYGILERFRGLTLSQDDVPLAVIYWTVSGGIRFIDRWAVRRRVASSSASPGWEPLYSEHRDAEAEAALFQFQEHALALRAESAILPTAESRFVYLPAAGYLPVGTGDAGWKQFLGVHAPERETPIDAGLLRAVVKRSFGEAPVRVIPASPAPATPPTKFTVYRTAGRDGFVVFARAALAERIARDVYFDATECRMPGVSDVQSAIDALCRAARCCSIVVSPKPGWERTFDQIGAGEDAHVCFEAGTFALTEPLVVRGKGHVTVSGAGPGTRVAIASGETAMRFESCAGVRVHAMHFEGGAASSKAATSAHLNGALTLIDCAAVQVEAASFRCAAGTVRAACCLTIRNTRADAVSHARVRHCDFVIGHQQVGLLVVNVGRIQVEDNLMRLGATPPAAILAADPRHWSILRRRLISRFHHAAGLNNDKPPPGFNATVKYGGVTVYVATDSTFVRAEPKDNLWSDALHTLAPRNVGTPGRLVGYLERLSGYAFQNGGAIKGFPSVPLANAYKAIVQQLGGAAAQGVVIAGAMAEDVRIKDNSIEDAVQGVHVGMSHEGGTRRVPDSAGVVVVERNTVRVALTPAHTRERHGVFIGNAVSVIVKDNRLALRRSGNKASQSVEGVRLVGHYGPRVIVRANDLHGFNTGIRFEPRLRQAGQSFPATPQWIITDNFANQAAQVLVLVMDNATKNKVRGRLDNFA